MESSEPSRTLNVMRLLYKAVIGLPEDEQAAVVEYFLELGIAPLRPPGPAPAHPFSRENLLASGTWPAGLFTAQRGAGPNQQLIPVRLSEDAHRRLKQWCADHDFHMSVVVRGLIERFLDGWQEPVGGGAAGAGR